MSNRVRSKSPTPLLVEIESGDEADRLAALTVSPRLRQDSVIEINSDFSSAESEQEDVEITGENRRSSIYNNTATSDDLEITGLANVRSPAFDIEFPGAPPRRRTLRQNASSRAASLILRPPRRRNQQDSSFRNVRRRQNPLNPRDRSFYQTTFFPGSPSYSILSFDDIPAMLAEHHRLLLYFQSQEGEVSSAIMERINREEEHSLDRKMESENKHNRKVLEQKKGVAQEELKGYTNDISPANNLMCELCGVVLGEGIPNDFEPNLEHDENIEQHISSTGVQAPWFCIRQCFDTDKALSKRVFAAKCGHVFCGRCIKNIGNRPPAKRGKTSNKVSILNPQISAPRKCPAKECGLVFSKGKRTFTEIFL